MRKLNRSFNTSFENLDISIINYPICKRATRNPISRDPHEILPVSLLNFGMIYMPDIRDRFASLTRCKLCDVSTSTSYKWSMRIVNFRDRINKTIVVQMSNVKRYATEFIVRCNILKRNDFKVVHCAKLFSSQLLKQKKSNSLELN